MQNTQNNQNPQKNQSQNPQKANNNKSESSSQSSPDVASYLKGATYPQDRSGLRQFAQKNGAKDDVLKKFDELPDGKQFKDISEVTKACGCSDKAA